MRELVDSWPFWAVYLFFFKLLGLFLLAVELAWFVARPIGAELRMWSSSDRPLSMPSCSWA